MAHTPEGTTAPSSITAVSLLTTREAARRLRVSQRTVLAWAQSGKLASTRTPGGHRRYPAAAVDACAERMRELGERRA